MKPLAEKLIARSFDFVDFVSADMEQFRRIGRLDDTAIAEVKLTQATSIYLLRQRVMGRSAVSSWTKLIDYCRPTQTDRAHRK